VALTFVPYGKLADGKYGIPIEDGTNRQLASAIEIVSELPDQTNPDNFDGRMVYVEADKLLYVWRDVAANRWRVIDGVPVTVDASTPPTVPTPESGALFYSTINRVLYMWDGGDWLMVGGELGGTIIGQTFIGNGVTDTYATGVSGILPSQFVFVYLDGVVQTPISDYISVGNNIQFTTPPANGTRILLRTLSAVPPVQNAEVLNRTYTGDGSTTSFDTGAIALNSAAVIVSVNGLVKRPVNDYNIVSQSTVITSLTRTGTTATAVTASTHGLSIGSTVTLAGISPTGWNNTFTVLTVPSTTVFSFSISSSVATPGTGSPTMYFQPPRINDKVLFAAAPANGAAIDIRVFKSVITAPPTGEVNTLSTVGPGLSIVYGKSGVDLQVKSLASGQYSTVVVGDDTFAVNVEDITLREARIETTTTSYSPPTTCNYVAVLNTALPVTINLGNFNSIGLKGRIITIGDETGGASINNISVTHATANFNGSAGPLTINTDYGYVRLHFDGTDFFIRGQG